MPSSSQTTSSPTASANQEPSSQATETDMDLAGSVAPAPMDDGRVKCTEQDGLQATSRVPADSERSGNSSERGGLSGHTHAGTMEGLDKQWGEGKPTTRRPETWESSITATSPASDFVVDTITANEDLSSHTSHDITVTERDSAGRPSPTSSSTTAHDNVSSVSLPNPVIIRCHDSLPYDIRAFLLNYPADCDSPNSNINVAFYANQIPLEPGNLTIDEFHQYVFRRYDLLEAHHGYIQWLFPIREQGLNYRSAPLQVHEAKVIRRNPRMQERLLQSLVLMLDFFGMQLHDTTPLLITRHFNPIVCAKQYRNLCESWHNYLRITRILKSLVELGKGDYVPSILLFILSEQSQNNALNRRTLRDSMDRFWCYCMRDRDAQATVAAAVKWVREQEGEFTTEVYRRVVERRVAEGVWRFDPLEEGCARREKKNRGVGTGYTARLRRFSNH